MHFHGHLKDKAFMYSKLIICYSPWCLLLQSNIIPNTVKAIEKGYIFQVLKDDDCGFWFWQWGGGRRRSIGMMALH
jgi:hypothetical protein